MLIGVPVELAAGEARVAVTPETAKKLIAQGHTVRVQSGAGVAASVPDEAYAAVGAELVDVAAAWGSDLVLKVRAPEPAEVSNIKAGSTVVGMLEPFNAEALQRLAAAGATGFALEAAPRTTRAQSMDVLSSQANIAGYKAVMLAADKYQRFFPMLMTAAGTVKAARVVVLGVGVAGELEISERFVDLLAAYQLGQQIQFLRADPLFHIVEEGRPGIRPEGGGLLFYLLDPAGGATRSCRPRSPRVSASSPRTCRPRFASAVRNTFRASLSRKPPGTRW